MPPIEGGEPAGRQPNPLESVMEASHKALRALRPVAAVAAVAAVAHALSAYGLG